MNVKRIQLIVSLAIFLLSFDAYSAELGPYRYLRKISRKVRGLDPEQKDKTKLKEILKA